MNFNSFKSIVFITIGFYLLEKNIYLASFFFILALLAFIDSFRSTNLQSRFSDTPQKPEPRKWDTNDNRLHFKGLFETDPNSLSEWKGKGTVKHWRDSQIEEENRKLKYKGKYKKKSYKSY